MIGNILKFTVTILSSYFIGLTFGFILGFFLSGPPAIFIKEIMRANLAVLISVSLSISLGGLLGFLALQMANKFFDADDKAIYGILLGIALGLFIVFYWEGVIYLPPIESYTRPMIMLPIVYSCRVGTYIGAITFPIIGAARIGRDLVANYKEARKH